MSDISITPQPTPPPATPAPPAPRPRRRSIFGGLLWLTVGSLLLANNLGANFDAWEMISQFWPVLLIALGVAKLFEHVAARQRGEAPARLLSGGEVFLMILLIMGGIAYAGAIEVCRDGRVDCDLPWESEYTYTEEVTQAVKSDSQITVTVPRGAIRVISEDAAEIRVVASKNVRGGGESDAQARAKDYAVVIAPVGQGYEVRVNTGGRAFANTRVDLEVHVPRKSNVVLRTDRGDVSVVGVQGNVTTDSARGQVEVRDIGGNVDVESNGGDVSITGAKGNVKFNGRGSELELADIGGQAIINGEFHAPIRARNVAKEFSFKSNRTEVTAEKVDGHVELSSDRMEIVNVPGSVGVNTSSYDIMIEGVSGRVRVENRNGGVEVRMAQAPKQDIEIENQKGAVELVMPAASAFEIQASTRQGEIENDFSDPNLKTTDSENIVRLEGKVGGKGPQIRVKTTYGTVRLRKTP